MRLAPSCRYGQPGLVPWELPGCENVVNPPFSADRWPSLDTDLRCGLKVLVSRRRALPQTLSFGIVNLSHIYPQWLCLFSHRSEAGVACIRHSEGTPTVTDSCDDAMSSTDGMLLFIQNTPYLGLGICSFQVCGVWAKEWYDKRPHMVTKSRKSYSWHVNLIFSPLVESCGWNESTGNL